MNTFNQILKEVFYALTVSLVVFVFMEILWTKSVLVYLNMNYVLLAWVINVILLLVFNREIEKKKYE